MAQMKAYTILMKNWTLICGKDYLCRNVLKKVDVRKARQIQTWSNVPGQENVLLDLSHCLSFLLGSPNKTGGIQKPAIGGEPPNNITRCFARYVISLHPGFGYFIDALFCVIWPGILSYNVTDKLLKNPPPDVDVIDFFLFCSYESFKPSENRNIGIFQFTAQPLFFATARWSTVLTICVFLIVACGDCTQYF